MLDEKINLHIDLMLAGVDETLDNKPFYRQKPVSLAPQPRAPQQKVKISTSQLDLTTISSLEELRDALNIYEGCALKKSAQNMVFGEGNVNADIMLIGEAPSLEDDKIGRPFVGKSGKLLDIIMAAIGLTRDDFYITNSVYWRPPSHRQPTPEEVSSCSAFLNKQIELINPKIILTLGAIASKALTDKTEGITKLRGNWHKLAGHKDIKIMPTFHPANLLRTPLNKRFVWQDLLSLKQKHEELP